MLAQLMWGLTQLCGEGILSSFVTHKYSHLRSKHGEAQGHVTLIILKGNKSVILCDSQVDMTWET